VTQSDVRLGSQHCVLIPVSIMRGESLTVWSLLLTPGRFSQDIVGSTSNKTEPLRRPLAFFRGAAGSRLLVVQDDIEERAVDV
jgi:hypothetical protein